MSVESQTSCLDYAFCEWDIYIPHCPGNCGKIHKLKDMSSRLDQDIIGTKKPLSLTGALKSCYISCPNLEGVRVTMYMSISWHYCRPNLVTKTLEEKAMDLTCHLLRASCNAHYSYLLNSLAWTDYSQQSYGSMMTLPFLYSDVTTLKVQPVYICMRVCVCVFVRVCVHVYRQLQYITKYFTQVPMH